MKAALGLVALAAVVLLGAGRASAGACTTAHSNAHGDNRTVNVKVLNFWLHHTYECLQYNRSPPSKISGHHSYGGEANGCSNCSRFSTTTVNSNAPQCIAVQGKLHYAVTGVCHQGTNRALQPTPVPYVKDWGGVGGAGTSYVLFCNYGAAWSCYGPPC